MFDPISQGILKEIEKLAKEEESEKASRYWAKCPGCGKKVVRRQILEQGCWVCGWKGSEEELELSQAKMESGGSKPSSTSSKMSYKTKCPNCGKLVITEELREKGCYLCGWRGIL